MILDENIRNIIDHRSMYWMQLCAANVTPANPEGYIQPWLVTPEAEAKKQMERGDRVVLRLVKRTPPAEGWDVPRPDHGWGVPSNVWYPIDRWRREILIEAALNARHLNPAHTFGLYIGGEIGTSPYTRYMTHSDHIPDLNNAQDRQIVDDNLGPWVESGAVKEVWLDAAARDHSVGAAFTFVMAARDRYGIHFGIEAYPHTTGQRWPDDITWGNYVVPLLAMSNYIETRDPDHELTWDPETTEVHVLNNPSRQLSPQEMLAYKARGFIPGSCRKWLDDTIPAL